MNAVLSRLAIRLLIPVLALSGLALLGDPLPAQGGLQLSSLASQVEQARDLIEAGRQRIEANRDERSGGGADAATMRLLITVPAFTRHCITRCDG